MAQVKELKEVVSRDLRFPLDRLKLVKGGKPLDDDVKAAGLADGGVLCLLILLHAHVFMAVLQKALRMLDADIRRRMELVTHIRLLN